MLIIPNAERVEFELLVEDLLEAAGAGESEHAQAVREELQKDRVASEVDYWMRRHAGERRLRERTEAEEGPEKNLAHEERLENEGVVNQGAPDPRD